MTGYESALEDLWRSLLPSLTALEHVAAVPSERLEENELACLRYALHRGAELAHGLDPPLDAQGSHDELADALEEAREATATVADALAVGGVEAAEPLVWEWRGSLFRVRLARLRLAPVELVQAPATPAARHGVRRSVLAVGVLLCGVGLVLGGALAELWPLWTAGIALVLASLLLSAGRP